MGIHDIRHTNAAMSENRYARHYRHVPRQWTARKIAMPARHAHAITIALPFIMSLVLMLPMMPAESAYAHTTEGTDVPQACSYGMPQACGVDRMEDAMTAATTDDDGNAVSTHQMTMDRQPIIRQADDSGSGSYMTNLDLTNLAQKDNDTSDDSGGGSNFVQNALKAMQQIVNTVLLPIGIVVVVARLMYIAVFPLMIGIDPFDVIDTDSFREGPQSVMRRTTRGGNGDGSKDPTFGVREYDWGGKGDWRVKLTQEQIEYIMKQELIGSGKVLLWIIVVWGVINLAIWLAGTVLGYFHI